MCGIAGFVYPSGGERPNLETLQRMNRRLTHRGPDDEGYYLEGSTALAMRRLKIIDLEGGHQPIANETGDIWTVFNGEIYNFQELKAGLQARGHQFKSKTDTEVIVHLYEEHGEAFVSHLRGMFAIALWDVKKKTLFLYRDRLGIKPLHYAEQGGKLIFGSEIKALLEHAGVQQGLSMTALYDYLSYLYIPGPLTVYEGIFKLPPGHALRWKDGVSEIWRYWDIAYETEQGVSEKEWSRRILETLEESIRLHTISDVPLGAFLSGGIDSSTVCALLSRVTQDPVKTYTMGFADAKFNELPYAREVAQWIQSDHHEQLVSPEAVNLLPQIMAAFDEPFADSSAIPTYLVSQFARQDVTVALSGDGGDELFGGYGWTQKEIWLEKYRALPGALRRSVDGFFLDKNYEPLPGGGAANTLRRFLFDANSSPRESFFRRVRCFQPWTLRRLCRPEVWEKVRLRNVLAEQEARAQHLEVISRLLYLDSVVYLPDDLLTKVDRMSMAHSLEVRVPLLDHKVVELAARIPSALKFKGRTTKYILKQAIRPYLPKGTLKQRKHGFSVPLNAWFRTDLSDWSEKLLMSESSRLHAYFEPEMLRTLLLSHRSGAANLGSSIYALTMLELWMRGQEQSTEHRVQSTENRL